MGVKRRIAALAAALFLLVPFSAFTAQAAAGDKVHSVDISVELAENGDAVVTEVWDVTVPSGSTEWYIEKLDLDRQEISELYVSEAGVPFTNVGEWDIDKSREEKAYTCGIVTRGDGYELCWGVGSGARHTFTVSYRITNMVKQYSDAAVIYQVFLSAPPAPVQQLTVTVSRRGFTMREENTGVWGGGGATGEVFVKNGRVEAQSTAPVQTQQSFALLVQFADGIFRPGITRGQNFESLKEEALGGTGYVREEPRTAQSAVSAVPFFILPIGVLAIIAAAAVFISKSSRAAGERAKKYTDVPYSRQLPWNGSMKATYARLKELGALESEGAVIGAYLLRWVRTRQVELVKTQPGVFKGKGEDAIRLFAPRDGMEPAERTLYDMLVAAAGADYTLQSKEFERWSHKKYERVEGWLTQYVNQGKSFMRGMGAFEDRTERVFFGLVPVTKTAPTELGERLTAEMFGFKRYLEEFTVINEREAREVQLWDEYLVYAQLFGIADKVAEQFRQLYPDYFRQVASELGYGGLDMYDIFLVNHIARSYSRAMLTGYRAGYNAALSSSFSGGGGGFSGGGGFGGASGGGGGSGSR